MMDQLRNIIKNQLGSQIDLKKKRPGVFQIVSPFFYEDGDMFDIFIKEEKGKIILSDFGMTLMRLSYEYDIDSPSKKKIFLRIIAENHAKEEDGEIIIETTENNIFQSIIQLSQVISKVSNMRLYKREVVKSLFYEELETLVMTEFVAFEPKHRFFPIKYRDELEVDFLLSATDNPIYLFGVKDNAKARLAAISCLEFQKADMKFDSIIVHENWNPNECIQDAIRMAEPQTGDRDIHIRFSPADGDASAYLDGDKIQDKGRLRV